MDQNPKIYLPEYGKHNKDLEEAINRLKKSKSYQDLSTIIICPTRGVIPARVVQSWLSLMRPMNQKVIGPLFATGMEVGEAYNQMILSILSNPELSTYKYVLTIEEDNMPPCDGLLKLYENIDKYDVVGGLYWTKGDEGQPMIYGDPNVTPKNFIPQLPKLESIQPCNGMGMGFHLFRMDIFKKMPSPWFKTLQEVSNGGARTYTQDLFFYEEGAKYGFTYACDTRVSVGHYAYEQDIVW
jgi:hypothetical protein